jgi:Primase C terminal 1 (PriCT-1)
VFSGLRIEPWLISERANRLGSARPARYDAHVGKYRLVDFAAHYQKGFRNHIVPIEDVAGLTERYKSYGCYCTYFFYSDEVLTYMSAQPEGATPSIAGYEGKVWAPFLPLDLDHPELLPALEAAKRLSALLLERWSVDPDALQIYFSGSKGFHFMLDTRCFGRVAPSVKLPTIFDSLRRHLAQELPEPLRETIDLSIKDRVRLLRLPNTIHEKTKLYKVPIGAAELTGLSAPAIRELARAARPLNLMDATGLISNAAVEPNPNAFALFQRVGRQAARFTRKPFAYRFRRPADAAYPEFRCAGAQAIWQNNVEPGYRNNCAIRLASEFRLMGLTSDETVEKLLEWNQRNGVGLSASELESVAHSAFQHRFPYRYSCRDTILRKYCPLPNLASCRRHTATRAATE